MNNRISRYLAPRPLAAVPTYIRVPGFVVTSIARLWRPGDSGPEGVCRLCERCFAKDDMCVIMVAKYVPPDQAADFSTVGMKRQT
ncbi:hypothetical protein [Singulisphaera acidiphila]|uniref:Uncharacterized protein n=1 Tax=Singulisphaera acidiphila (strain ATCC BAA-1392 / DSM 18658 / VKM B-2454 / MOB10) TaxID=886293 RepID=L0DRJ7_SINAD|nr:hypothetical protein [Singulisphaera acidiphila]AGA31643.1 hypothetical protein Sinac_7612 [Singulisphaera acidiphila DSM 18658]